MTITIPGWVFTALFLYALVGVLLYVPLNHWAARFISPRRRGLQVWRGIRYSYIPVGVLASLAAWPLMIRALLRDEWRWGLGRRWRNRKI